MNNYLRWMRLAHRASRTYNAPDWADFVQRYEAHNLPQHTTQFDRFLGNYKLDNKPPDQRLAAPKSHFTSDGYLRSQHRADFQQVPTRLRVFAARLIEAGRSYSIPLYAHSAFRTRAEQDQMVARGVSKAHWPRAAHCQGAAVDIVHGFYHWDMTPDEWRFMGKLGKDIAAKMRLPIVWGGDWSFYDPAHWELADWRDNIRATEGGTPIRLTARKILADNKGYEYSPSHNV
ncbi:MAG: putative endolysin [Microviridae sp.]|nr:MAG: putative endolysin [Microviridae sp.]